MTFKQLLKELEKEIAEQMGLFTQHAMRSKQLRDEVDAEYAKMKKIVTELKYVLPIVKEQNPQLVPLLEELEK